MEVMRHWDRSIHYPHQLYNHWCSRCLLEPMSNSEELWCQPLNKWMQYSKRKLLSSSNIAYFIVKEETSFTMFPKLVTLHQKNVWNLAQHTVHQWHGISYVHYSHRFLPLSNFSNRWNQSGSFLSCSTHQRISKRPGADTVCTAPTSRKVNQQSHG